MSKTLDNALDVMCSTYLPFDVVVRGMVLDAKEVADALAKAIPDTQEFVSLEFLANQFPYTPTKVETIE